VNEIWFSHDYDKLPKNWKDSMVVLISVCEIDCRILRSNPSFLKYDTKIRDMDDFYDISFNVGITLLFYHPGANMIFTTIRSYTNEKYRYYFDLIGEEFTMRRRY